MTHAVQSNWKRISTTFINADKPPLVPIAILTIMVLAAIFAPLIAPDSPRIGSLSEKLLPPAWMEEGKISHLLGTDQQGRDVLSRLIYGARISLSVAALAVFFCRHDRDSHRRGVGLFRRSNRCHSDAADRHYIFHSAYFDGHCAGSCTGPQLLQPDAGNHHFALAVLCTPGARREFVTEKTGFCRPRQDRWMFKHIHYATTYST